MSAWGKGGTAKSCDALLARVEANDPTLTELVILPTKTFGAEQVERIAAALATGRNTHLQSLSASGHAIPPNSLARLGSAIALKKSGLVHLAIGHRTMGDDGVVALCSSLENAHGGLLEVVDLSHKDISTRGMEALGRTFGPSQRLRAMNISRNERIKNQGLDGFCKNALNRCEELDCVPFANLRELDLAECGIIKSVESLAKLFRERAMPLSLTLSGNPLGATACTPLATLLPLLSELFVSGCNLGNEGIIGLSAADGGSCDSLKLLDLSNNGIDQEGAAALGQLLWDGETSRFPSLQDVRLAGNNMGTAGVKAIDDAISGREKPLESLDLSQTNCDIDGAVVAVQCTNLESLRLFNNKLGSDGFSALAQVQFSSLMNLDLGGNNADEASVVEFLESLQRQDVKLRVLEIGGNAGGDSVEEAVKQLQSIHPDLDVARDKPKRQN